MATEEKTNVAAIQRCLEALSAEAKEAGFTMLSHIISFAANCAREEAADVAPARRPLPQLRLIKGGRL